MLWEVKFLCKNTSYNILTLADSIAPSLPKKIIGLRPGEKIHEEMITTSDSFTTIDLGKYYAVLPTDGSLNIKYKDAGISYTAVEEGFSYTSGNNSNFPHLMK